MNCRKCGGAIPPARLKALPSATTCVACSDVQPVRGFRLITGKNTYSELQLVNPDAYQQLTKLQERKGQSPGHGIKR